MKHTQFMIGLIAIAACATLAGVTLSPHGAAAQSSPRCDATATPSGDIAPFGITSTDTPTATATATATGTATDIPTSTPIPTCTPVRRIFDTPTATPAATDTPAPAVPTHTPAPVATKPGGGTEGVGVHLPDTGSGPDGQAVNWLALAGAAMLAASGAGALAVGARRRR